MLLLEILLSIHCLLFISSWMIGGRWLANQPSFKLKLARLLLISCVISPFIVHGVNTNHKLETHHYASVDALQDYVSQPILKSESSQEMLEPVTTFSIGNISYFQLVYGVFFLLLMFRAYRVLFDLRSLRAMLAEAIPYRTSGKLVIKVSSKCHIPFSVSLWNKAYIVLPVSLLSSITNVRIAIAHEGQHHRNGDCLWAYFIEFLRILFMGNPGMTRWSRILSELQEFSCDEVLVGQPKISAHDYGHCLFDVIQAVSQCSQSSNREIACTVGMALSKDNEDCTFIIRRISMLSTYPSNKAKSLLLGVAFAGFSILTPICAAYSAVGSLTGSKANEVDTSHLDPKMQNIAEQEIRAAVKQYHAKSAAIAIANAKTGDIIAFAASGKNPSSWKSRIFSPASTIKPFIAAAAIDSGSSSATKIYDCRSPYSLEGKSFTNYNPKLASASLKEAMAQSINVCFIKVAQEAGVSVIRKKLADFGFDTNSWWQANQSENMQLANASLGENIPVTMQSLTKAYAILANKGHSFDSNTSPVISEKTTNTINQMLENAVANGTGKRAAIPGVAVAGKTGTLLENKDNHLALFAGYTPANAPQYVMLIVIEEGHLNQNGETLTSGGELTAPVFRRVAMNSMK